MRVLFVVGPPEFYASTTVRVRQYFDRLRSRGIEPHELQYGSATRERWYHALISGGRRIRSRPVRQCVRVALYAWNAMYVWVRQAELLLRSRRFDVIYVQYMLLPIWLVRWLAGRDARLVYDFDDAVFLRQPARAQAIVAAAWRVVAGSHFNLEYALRLNPRAVLIPSAVPVEAYGAPPPAARAGAVVRIGWIGGPATLHYLALLVDPLQRLQARGLPIELLVAGSRDRPELIPDFGELPLTVVPTYSAAELPGIVDSFDIGVMPLLDGPWERGKCAMKALVYMAGARPAVCSPVGEANYVIQDGVSGCLADGPDDWERLLAALITAPSLRASMGARGRAVVSERYSTAACFELLMEQVFRASPGDGVS